MLKFVFINTFVGENPGGVIAEQLKDAGLLDGVFKAAELGRIPLTFKRLTLGWGISLCRNDQAVCTTLEGSACDACAGSLLRLGQCTFKQNDLNSIRHGTNSPRAGEVSE